MSNSTHKSLVRLLLWWVTVLSVGQVVLLVLFFTTGHFGQSNDSAQGQSGQQSSSELGNSSDKSRMFTFKASGVLNGSITWHAIDLKDLPTDEGQYGILNIKKDGYFFMCLRITLVECSTSEDKGTERVRVGLVRDNEPIVFASINNKTCSTELLCKMARLEAGNTLRGKIESNVADPSKIIINNSLTVSYLDIIYVPN